MLQKAALVKRPLVISTGMQTTDTIERIVKIMTEANKSNYALMHCVSSYPTEPQDCQLIRIRWLRQKYPHVVIGYSGHELGVDISKAAVLLGARLIERHFTLDKKHKGSDHRCSLEPNEMTQLVVGVIRLLTLEINRGLTNAEVLSILNDSSAVKDALHQCAADRSLMPCEINCFKKLGKSLVAAKPLFAGHTICAQDIWVKVSEPNGIAADRIDTVIGSKLITAVECDKPFLWEHLSTEN